MKKLLLLTITLLMTSLNAMEGKQNGVPSLTKLCAKAFTHEKTVIFIQQHENAPEYYASFFENSLPYLEADIACGIISKLPQNILDANGQLLKDMLCGDLQKKSSEHNIKISPAVKAAMVKKITLEPTIIYALFDSVFDIENKHPDKNILGCALFEHYKELQTWKNILKLADQGPITVGAAQVAIESIELVYLNNTIKQLPHYHLSEQNKEVFRKALLGLITTPLFFPQKLEAEYSEEIIGKDGWKVKQKDNTAFILDEAENELATFALDNNTEVLNTAISKDENLFLLLTHQQNQNLNVCLVHDKHSKKKAAMILPLLVEEIHFDTNNNCIIVLSDSNTQCAIELPLFYFEGKALFSTAIQLYVAQEFNKKNKNLETSLAVNSSYNTLVKLEKDKSEASDSDLTPSIENAKFLISQLNKIIEARDHGQIKAEILEIINTIGSVKTAVTLMEQDISHIEHHINSQKNTSLVKLLTLTIEQEKTILKLIEVAQELGIVDEIEQKLAQESKEEE